MIASTVQQADVIGAWVAVVTDQGTRSHTEPVYAAVLRGTGVAVVTGAIRGLLDTPLIPKTSAGGARVAVVTAEGSASLASSRRAQVADGAHVAVIAGLLVVYVGTSAVCSATVIGAGITVVARDGLSPVAVSVRAGGVHRAGVAVVAEAPLVGGLSDADPRSGDTDHLLALTSRTGELLAGFHRLRAHLASVGQRGEVAEQGAVTEVSVLLG